VLFVKMLSVDIWAHISVFFDYFYHGQTLLSVCRNSRLGLLRCYPFWAKMFPRHLATFRSMPIQKPGDLGGYCMYILGELRRKRLKWKKSISLRRIEKIQAVIASNQRMLENEKDNYANLITKYEEIEDNHFDIRKTMKVTKALAQKALKGCKRRRR
jgi:hypothetical protein